MMIGTRIKELRESSGYRQTDLADAVGCSAQVISNIERGVTDVSADMARRIASALHVPIEEVMSEADTEEMCLTKDEIALLVKYRCLTPRERKLLLDMFDLVIESL